MRFPFWLSIFSFAIITTSCKGRFYKASSTSMENTIKVGETFYVTNADSFKKNDIVVFDFWGDDYTAQIDEVGNYKKHWEKRVYRVTAISGDSLRIVDGDIFVNGKYDPPLATAKQEYDIFSKVMIDDFPENGNAMAQEMGNGLFHYIVNLTKAEAAVYLERKNEISEIKKTVREYDDDEKFLIIPCSECEWSVDNFGPVYIPLPGETVLVDSLNYKLYQNIPGIAIGKNIIKEKLYFLTGDNRHAAADSRYTGYITHSKINGIVK